MPNIEIKAHYPNLDKAKAIANLEFEAVYQNESSESEKLEHQKVQELLKTFEIDQNDLLSGSYREMEQPH
ncbi:MAG: hypothetical protein HY072_04775 [Deltaproteobacteria bacterium]|nr:hypothetical protein [Deltaproteobacteria bacterium]